ncbi:MAG: hypothetical protein K6B70_02440 [Clostridia bacterium]|nr:hypothetical protein [Clostridia bacterium]
MRRTNQVARAFKENRFIADQIRETRIIPPSASILVDSRSRKIRIVIPKFKSKEEYELEDNNRVFVEMNTENRGWLGSFANEIVECGHIAEYPFYNSTLDIKNPGISAYRINAKDGYFAQVQVRRIPDIPTLFQLDYFESNEFGTADLQLIALCNLIDYEHPLVDLVYYPYYSDKAALDFGQKIGTNFQNVLIYMRPWDYNCGCKSVEITPLNLPCWH